MNPEKLNPSSTCVIAKCNDSKLTNSCIGKRDPDAITDVEITPKPDEDGHIFFADIDERFQFIRLFQQIETNEKKLELHDIVINLSITSFHDPTNNHFELELANDQHADIFPLKEKLKLKFYIIEICDKDTAIQLQPGIGDILLERDLKDIQFRDYINPILEFVEEIDCEGCQFQNHEFTFCIDFGQLEVCKLDTDQNDAITFDKGNYAFLIIIDYMDWMYRFKITANMANPEKFGNRFDLINGNCGTPLFITKFHLESTWKPVSSINTIDALFNMINKCCEEEMEQEL